MTPTYLDILLVALFTWSLKVRFSSSVTPRNLTVETFVMIDFRILISNGFCTLEIIIYEVLLTSESHHTLQGRISSQTRVGGTLS